eukprot:jgi/Psemu1/146885/gw1.96.83.1
MPFGVKPLHIRHKQLTRTTNGEFDTSHEVQLKEMQLPKFVNGRRIVGISASIFELEHCRYDVILGRDFISSAGIILSFNNHTVTCMDVTTPMRDTTKMTRVSPEEAKDTELFKNASTEILERSYQRVTAKEVARQQNHMTEEQKRKFQKMIQKHEVIFNGKLGLYPHEEIHIKLKKDAKPIHMKPYPVAYQREEIFRK